MKISVLIAAHKSAECIGDALASLHAQTHLDWELLVVEYGSADGTRALVQAFGELTGRPVTHLNLGVNRGLASARNRLLDLATGEWVAFLDPSHQWTPPHLTNAALRLLTAVDVVASNVRIEDGALPAIELVPSPHLGLNPVRTLFVSDALPFASAVALRRELATAVGFFDPHLRDGDVHDFWLRCALQGARFASTHRWTCRVGRTATLTIAERHLRAESQLQFYEKHQDLPSVPAALRRRLLASSLISRGRLMRVSDPLAAAQHFFRAWSLQPMHIQTLGQLALIGSRREPAAKVPFPHGPDRHVRP
jgi:glycosyltransferase involved in cell wall biosynthesis